MKNCSHHTLLLIITLVIGPTLSAQAGICSSDNDCNNRLYCDGIEKCEPASRSADARGCVKDTTPRCTTGQRCDETQDRCIMSCWDHDGDGHEEAACGGDDCDDRDAGRYPGHAEICDARGHDEDCNPSTIGFKDSDGDGFVDATCSNY